MEYTQKVLVIVLGWILLGMTVSALGHWFVQLKFGDNDAPYDDILYYRKMINFLKDTLILPVNLVVVVVTYLGPLYEQPKEVLKGVFWTLIWPLQVLHSVFKMIHNEKLELACKIIEGHYRKYDCCLSRSRMVEDLGISRAQVDDAITLCLIYGFLEKKVSGCIVTDQGNMPLYDYVRGPRL